MDRPRSRSPRRVGSTGFGSTGSTPAGVAEIPLQARLGILIAAQHMMRAANTLIDVLVGDPSVREGPAIDAVLHGLREASASLVRLEARDVLGAVPVAPNPSTFAAAPAAAAAAAAAASSSSGGAPHGAMEAPRGSAPGSRM